MKTGLEIRYRLCGFAVIDDANNLLLCWLSSTFWRTLGLFANIFQACSVLGDVLDALIGGFFRRFPAHLVWLSDEFWGTLGFS